MTDEHHDGDLEVIDLAGQIDPAPSGPLVPPDGQRRRRAGSGGWLGRSLSWILAVVVVVAVWAGVAVATLLGIRGDVVEAREDLLVGRDDLIAGDVGTAEQRFADAAAVMGDLPDRVDSPLVWPARLLPAHRRTLDAVASLGRAGQVAAGAAAEVAGAIGQGEGDLGALTPRGGRMPIGAVEELAPVLQSAAQELASALELARAAPTRGVDQSVVDGRAEFIELVEPTVAQLELGAEVADVLPAMFGADGPRRYLVMASNPAEMRGTGGFFGAYTVMEADDGVLSFSDVGETQALPIPPAGSVAWPDPSLEARYDLYGGATRVRSINMTPDFPAAAQTLENYWSVAMGQEVDGVIAVDPFAFETLLGISGPATLEGFGEITAEEVVEFVSRSAYSLIEDPERRKRLIGEVAMRALQRFLDGPSVSPGEVLEALGEMVRRDSLLLHVDDPTAQDVLVRAGLAGELDHGDGDLLAVVLNSGSGSKIDYWLDRTIRYDVTLQDDGVAHGIVSAGFDNNAPTSGELAYMIGPPTDYEVDFGAGDNVLLASAYCAPGCTFAETPDIGYADLPTSQSEELGYPVASTWMLIPSTRARELIFSYSAPGAWERVGGDQVYRLRYLHQTGVRPVDLQIRVQVPEGHEVVDLPETASMVDGAVEVQLEAVEDLDLEITFRAS